MNLTIAYITGRKEPRIEWFADSLSIQSDDDKPSVIVVDRFATRDSEPLREPSFLHFGQVIHSLPKPNVWQGEYRLTKEDWWAMSNARNTALCLCRTDYIAYVDDLSVLLPGWLDAVKEAMAGNYIACGSYKKVRNLKVENGVAVSFDEFADGLDHRLARVTEDLSPCDAGWLFGCSCLFPVEALLTVNGWPEYVDSLGAEDYTLGIALKNAGYHLKYDRRMMTLESWEDHFIGQQCRKEDWHFENSKPVIGGNGHDDKSHAALNIAKQSRWFPNTFDIRELRTKVLNGSPFPVDQNPQHDWYTGIALKDL